MNDRHKSVKLVSGNKDNFNIRGIVIPIPKSLSSLAILTTHIIYSCLLNCEVCGCVPLKFGRRNLKDAQQRNKSATFAPKLFSEPRKGLL